MKGSFSHRLACEKNFREKHMTEKEKRRVARILERLDKEYGTDFRCYLHYETPWQLLIATILSAQCTDARVNLVTKDLFVKYDSKSVSCI